MCGEVHGKISCCMPYKMVHGLSCTRYCHTKSSHYDQFEMVSGDLAHSCYFDNALTVDKSRVGNPFFTAFHILMLDVSILELNVIELSSNHHVGTSVHTFKLLSPNFFSKKKKKKTEGGIILTVTNP